MHTFGGNSNDSVSNYRQLGLACWPQRDTCAEPLRTFVLLRPHELVRIVFEEINHAVKVEVHNDWSEIPNPRERRPQVHVLSDTSHKLINMYAKSRQSGSRNDKNMRVRRAGRTRETRERGESKR